MLCGEAGHEYAICGIARKSAQAAEKIRIISEQLPAGSPAALKEALAGLERDLSCAAGGLPSGRQWPPDGSARLEERQAKVRGLVRLLLNFYSSHILADQRSRAYSRQECLDDVELMLEMLSETLER